jgi:hypothetical protein
LILTAVLTSDLTCTHIVDASHVNVAGAESLHGVKLVFPPVVRLGGEATLLCLYDLEGQPLYSVKWYRGNQEFYRYMPKESPPGRTFPFEGIVVDVSEMTVVEVKILRPPSWPKE